MSPDIENILLKNVLKFEHKFANSPFKTVFEILERPEVKKERDLSDNKIAHALTSLEDLMEQKGIVVDYAEEYDTRVKYKFLTEELFFKEATSVNIPGMTMHYIYEEFRPSRKL